jgi:PAS domain S-box-containing protein
MSLRAPGIGEQEPITVFHVDDDPEVASLTADFLEREHDNLSVRTESCPQTVAEMITDESKSCDADCIVSDYDMPRMDGLELFEAIRESGDECPFILYTGKGSEEIASEAIHRGVTEYLQKSSGQDHYTLLGNRIRHAVSEHRKHNALQESEGRYRSLVEQSPNAVHVIKDGEMVYANRQFVELLDADSRSEMLGLSPTDYVHPDDRAAAEERIQRLMEGEPTGRHVGKIVTLDGETKHVEVADSRITHDGEPAGQVVLSDITDRKTREREIRTAKRKFEAVFEYSNDAIFVVDVEADEIIDCNPAATELVGYSREELLSMTASDLHPHNLPKFMSFADSVLEDGHGWTEELSCYHKDGTEIPAEISAAVCEIEGRRCIVTNIRDVTGRKRRERELARVRERMEFALRRTDAVIWELDPETGDIRTYPDPCPVLEGTIDDIEEFLRQAHPSDRSALRDALSTGTETGEPARTEFRTREGIDTEWVGFRVEPVSNDDRTARLTGVARDITEQKRHERRVQRQKDRLEEFAEVASHDLRNPLSIAAGRLSLAAEECECETLDGVGDALDRMDRIIEDILWLAREGGEVDDLDPVDLGSIVRSTWDDATADHDSVELVGRNGGIEELGTIDADCRLLRRLLGNLFRNAVKHGSTSDQNESDDTAVTVTVGTLGDADGFYVADDGPGIPEEERDRVFERGHSTAEDGTGFGLSIVGRVTDAHGWTVRVTESDAGGARFEILGVDAR